MHAGVYNKTLSKMVYLGNRRFLPLSSPLRHDKQNFPSKSEELLPCPSQRTFVEVKSGHNAYDNAKKQVSERIPMTLQSI